MSLKSFNQSNKQRKNGRPFAQENEIRQKTQNQCV